MKYYEIKEQWENYVSLGDNTPEEKAIMARKCASVWKDIYNVLTEHLSENYEETHVQDYATEFVDRIYGALEVENIGPHNNRKLTYQISVSTDNGNGSQPIMLPEVVDDSFSNSYNAAVELGARYWSNGGHEAHGNDVILEIQVWYGNYKGCEIDNDDESVIWQLRNDTGDGEFVNP